MARTCGDIHTMNLLDWEPPQVSVGFDDGEVKGWNLASEIAKAVSLALGSTDLPREDVAEAMSDLLGHKISKDTLDAYASEGRPTHRIPLDRFIALVAVTECHDLLGFIAGRFGFAVVPARYADIIELHFIEEHERDVERRKLALKSKVGGR